MGHFALTATIARDEFRASRRLLGLSATDFARLWGVHSRTVNAWEEGHRDGKPCSLPFAAGHFLRVLLKSESARRSLGLKLGAEL
jgi:DNA-binding transcriptional regulator YiaG